MSISGTTIKKDEPVTVSDVRSVLGTSATGISALCQHSNINKYARYKPYGFGGILSGGLTDALRRANNYGMSPKGITDPGTSLTVAGHTPAWGQWAPPTGAYPSQPCRIGDFRGYDHSAQSTMLSLEFGNYGGWGYHRPVADNGNGAGYGHGDLRVRLIARTGMSAWLGYRDFTYQGLDLAGSYLTIMLDAVVDDLFLVGQAERPMGDDLSEWIASIPLDGFEMKTLFPSGDIHNRVVAGLAPRLSGLVSDSGIAVPQTGAWPVMVCLDMWGESGFPDTMYLNTGFASYGSGGEGGTRPSETFVVVGSVLATPTPIATRDDYGDLRIEMSGNFFRLSWDTSSQISAVIARGMMPEITARLYVADGASSGGYMNVANVNLSSVSAGEQSDNTFVTLNLSASELTIDTPFIILYSGVASSMSGKTARLDLYMGFTSTSIATAMVTDSAGAPLKASLTFTLP